MHWPNAPCIWNIGIFAKFGLKIRGIKGHNVGKIDFFPSRTTRYTLTKVRNSILIVFGKNSKKSILQRMVPSVGEIFNVCLRCLKESGYKRSIGAFSLSIVPQPPTRLCLFKIAWNWMTWEAEISNELGSLFCTKRALGWWILILGSGTNFRLILVRFLALMWQNKVLDAWKVLSQG